ncbi:glycosyltransferase 87 family protein [Nocardioides sp. R1-1]|uniref:glycosyltransferase 87 family protein n=1 Tax=Nocardioides sp. R1-1 TaxID=3383502 RepID=UPI0038D03AD0
MVRVPRGVGPATVLLAAAGLGALVGAAVGGFPDLHVYRYGGDVVLHQERLYAQDDPVTGYPFTYPPFAAVLMVPLALVPGWLAAALWTAASAAALVAAVVVSLRMLDLPAPGRLVAALGAGALALEPVWQSLSFGQVNLLVMVALLVDLRDPERRWSGAMVGLVAGVKLTPLVLVVLLVLAGHRPAAGRAMLAFAGTVVLGFVALPGSASAYWTDGLLDARRVGPPALAHNQSVYGALTRALGEPAPGWLWVAVAGPVALAVVGLAAVCSRRGRRLLAICLGAVAMLVASPVSWSHHWVWVVPLTLVLWQRSRLAGVTWATLFAVRPIVWPPWAHGREYDWRWFEHLPGNAYLLGALVLAGAVALRTARRP